MQSIRKLEAIYFKLRFDYSDDLAWASCVDWAVERLGLDEEGDDLEIFLLAIVERYLGVDRLDDQLAAGKYIVALRQAYLEGRETLHSIDIKLTQLYPKLGYPEWLGMLSRNCEYATDVPAFEDPFEKEFSYISALWAESDNRAEFAERYDPKTSQGHDINPA
jgi:hypothetical protein